MSFAFIFDSVGGTEWFVLLGVVLIVVGPRHLPAAARKLGRIMSNLRRAADEFKRHLMTMDQEIRSSVNNVLSDDSSSGSDSSGSSSDGSSDGSATDEGGNPYPEGSPYPGHEDFYDETSYDGGYGEDGMYGEEDGASASGDASPEPSEPAAPPAPPPPTDEELRRVTITVSKAPEKSS
jgi:Sec-independent protein translocase protein TatA